MPLSQPEAPRAPSSFAWPLVLVAVLNVLIVAFAVWTLAMSRRQYILQAQAATQNLAQVLEQNVVGTVNQIDLVLLSLKDEAERPVQPGSEQRLETALRAQFSRVRILEGIRLTDAQGYVVGGTGLPLGPAVSVQDRDYFQFLKAHAEAGLYISRPVQGRINRTWMVILARRLNWPDGSFKGLVYGTLTLDSLGKLLADVDVGQKGSISLRGGNLELLVRFPRSPESDRSIGDSRVEGDYLRAVQSNRSEFHFSSPSRIDGQPRTYAYRRIASPTFYILVGFAQEEFLAPWRQEVLMASLSVLALVGLSLGIVWMARMAWRRQARVKAVIEAQEAKFRLLAENAEDVIWTSDKNGILTYISPSVLTQRGYRPEELIGVPFQDREGVGDAVDPFRGLLDRASGLPAKSQPFEGEWIVAELPRKDGSRIQAEIRPRVIWGAHGEFLGLQGVTRDITQRIQKEAEREGLIRELRLALAEVKNLEGMLPICGHCKKIRDDHGYWNNVEAYLSQHTDATFTHGVCPDCAQIMREEMQTRRAQRSLD